MVITSGNHDSARRLGFSSRLIDAAGVFIRTDAASVGRPVLLADEHGPVAVYGLPYLDPDVVREPWGLAVRSHEAALIEAMTRVRADLRGRPGTRSVVLAHAFVAGAEPSDSERDISVGGVSRVATSVFDGVDYAALGHLHGRAHPHRPDPLQRLAARLLLLRGPATQGLVAGRARPHTASRTRRFIEAPVPRPLARLHGTLDELLTDPRLDVHAGAWVEATLTDERRPSQAMERLRGRFAHTLTIRFEPAHPSVAAVPVAQSRGRSDHEISLDFVRELRGAPASEPESALLQTACDACAEDPDVDSVLTEGLW